MKTLLVAVNAKYIHSNLAIYSIRSYCKAKGLDIAIAEYTINQQLTDILKDIYLKQPDFVGFSCYIWNIEYVIKIATELKKIMPDCNIWLGGPEVSYNPQDILEKYDFVNGVMIGEGEITFTKLIEYYNSTLNNEQHAHDINNIPGIAMRSPKIFNPPSGYINMDELPFPYEDFDDIKNRIVYYESSRGCPYSCSYCLSSVDKKVRYRSLELVKKELKVFIDSNVPQVKFVDRTFNCNKERTHAIWEFIKENDNGITNFHFEISADIITDDEIKLLSTLRPGLVQLEIGVQTTNPLTVDAIRRKMDFEKLSYVVSEIYKSRNVHQHLDLIAGLPYEDYESFKKSFNDVYNLKPDQLQLGFLKVLKGSYMEEQVSEFDVKYSSFPPYEVLSTPWLPYSDVLRLKVLEDMVEVYYNSGQFTATIKYLELFYDTPFELFEDIGNYYEENNLSGIGHSRIARYDILHDYFKEKAPLINEFMTYDLYLRENMKTRPSFANDIDMHKNTINDFIFGDAKIREVLSNYSDYSTKQIKRMTHIEPFSVDIINFINNGNIVMRDNYLLFDYMVVNKLNKSVRVVEILN